MEVKCICIDAKNRPKEIPLHKWLVEKQEYTINYTCRCMPQNITSVSLKEIDLDESNAPYEFFILNRFAFREEDIEKLKQLIKEWEGIDVEIKNLIEETNLIEN